MNFLFSTLPWIVNTSYLQISSQVIDRQYSFNNSSGHQQYSLVIFKNKGDIDVQYSLTNESSVFISCVGDKNVGRDEIMKFQKDIFNKYSVQSSLTIRVDSRFSCILYDQAKDYLRLISDENYVRPLWISQAFPNLIAVASDEKILADKFWLNKLPAGYDRFFDLSSLSTYSDEGYMRTNAIHVCSRSMALGGSSSTSSLLKHCNALPSEPFLSSFSIGEWRKRQLTEYIKDSLKTAYVEKNVQIHTMILVAVHGEEEANLFHNFLCHITSTMSSSLFPLPSDVEGKGLRQVITPLWVMTTDPLIEDITRHFIERDGAYMHIVNPERILLAELPMFPDMDSLLPEETLLVNQMPRQSTATTKDTTANLYRKDESGPKDYKLMYQELLLGNAELAINFMELSYPVLITDIDALWLQSPLEHLREFRNAASRQADSFDQCTIQGNGRTNTSATFAADVKEITADQDSTTSNFSSTIHEKIENITNTQVDMLVVQDKEEYSTSFLFLSPTQPTIMFWKSFCTAYHQHLYDLYKLDQQRALMLFSSTHVNNPVYSDEFNISGAFSSFFHSNNTALESVISSVQVLQNLTINFTLQTYFSYYLERWNDPNHRLGKFRKESIRYKVLSKRYFQHGYDFFHLHSVPISVEESFMHEKSEVAVVVNDHINGVIPKYYRLLQYRLWSYFPATYFPGQDEPAPAFGKELCSAINNKLLNHHNDHYHVDRPKRTLPKNNSGQKAVYFPPHSIFRIDAPYHQQVFQMSSVISPSSPLLLLAHLEGNLSYECSSKYVEHCIDSKEIGNVYTFVNQEPFLPFEHFADFTMNLPIQYTGFVTVSFLIPHTNIQRSVQLLPPLIPNNLTKMQFHHYSASVNNVDTGLANDRAFMCWVLPASCTEALKQLAIKTIVKGNEKDSSRRSKGNAVINAHEIMKSAKKLYPPNERRLSSIVTSTISKIEADPEATLEATMNAFRKVTEKDPPSDGFMTDIDESKVHYSIKIIAFNRPKCLDRLLKSLLNADYGPDSNSGGISLEIVIDGVKHPEDYWMVTDTIQVAQSFIWPHGKKNINIRNQHIGLQKQWMYIWKPISLNEFAFIFEDDTEVSPFFYMYARKAVESYYVHNDDTYLLHTIILDHMVKFATKLKAKKSRKSKTSDVPNEFPGDFWEFAELAKEYAGMSAALSGICLQKQTFAPLHYPEHSHIRTASRPYLYSTVGSWGPIMFPMIWTAFRLWWQWTVFINPEYIPSTHNLVINNFHKGNKDLWTPYFTRFSYELGLKCFYPNLPGNFTLVTNHREAGVNYDHHLGPFARLVTAEHARVLFLRDYSAYNNSVANFERHHEVNAQALWNALTTFPPLFEEMSRWQYDFNQRRVGALNSQNPLPIYSTNTPVYWEEAKKLFPNFTFGRNNNMDNYQTFFDQCIAWQDNMIENFYDTQSLPHPSARRMHVSASKLQTLPGKNPFHANYAIMRIPTRYIWIELLNLLEQHMLFSQSRIYFVEINPLIWLLIPLLRSSDARMFLFSSQPDICDQWISIVQQTIGLFPLFNLFLQKSTSFLPRYCVPYGQDEIPSIRRNKMIFENTHHSDAVCPQTTWEEVLTNQNVPTSFQRTVRRHESNEYMSVYSTPSLMIVYTSLIAEKIGNRWDQVIPYHIISSLLRQEEPYPSATTAKDKTENTMIPLDFLLFLDEHCTQMPVRLFIHYPANASSFPVDGDEITQEWMVWEYVKIGDICEIAKDRQNSSPNMKKEIPVIDQGGILYRLKGSIAREDPTLFSSDRSYESDESCMKENCGITKSNEAVMVSHRISETIYTSTLYSKTHNYIEPR